MSLLRGSLVAVLGGTFGIVCLASAADASDLHATVIGGTPAPPTWTFAAALIKTGDGPLTPRQACGAALIAPTWVVTGAHCADLMSQPGAVVAIGRANLDGSAAGDLRSVKSVHRHPDWTQASRTDDIALLELDRPSTQAPITTMATDAEPVWDGTPKGSIIGWGATVSPRGTPSPIALSAALPVFPDATCQRYLGPQFVSSKLLCGGDASASACNGDSGGPLVATDTKGRLVVAGVSSFGPGVCGQGPSFYTRLSGYGAWIQSVTGTDPTVPVVTTTTTAPAKKPVATTKKPAPTTKKKVVPTTKTKPPTTVRKK